MSDFDEYIKNKYPSDYLLMKVRYPDQELSELYSDQFEVWQHQQAIIDEHTEVIKLQDADLRKYEKQIESLKAQLNNMEACYIEKKKRVDELEGALNEVKEWKSHPVGHETSFGSWGVRDFYRGLAEKALRGGHD